MMFPPELSKINRDDAIETARAYIAQWEDLFRRGGDKGYIDGLSLTRIEFDRILKVLTVGIGELCK